MAKAREIIRRRRGVQNTRKITRTMELISTAKLKKFCDVILEARPYSQELFALVQDLLASGIELELAKKIEPVKRVLFYAISSNRGLCGAYNIRIANEVVRFLEEKKKANQEVLFYLTGKRTESILKYREVFPTKTLHHLDDRAKYPQIEELAKEWMELFLKGEVDEVYVLYTAFHSKAKQDLQLEKLLPLERRKKGERELQSPFIFEPSPEAVLSELAPLAIKNKLYQMFMEAITSEQAYRMRAMKNATENADNMIKELTRRYNRARQTQITMELLDIIGGASAIQ